MSLVYLSESTRNDLLELAGIFQDKQPGPALPSRCSPEPPAMHPETMCNQTTTLEASRHYVENITTLSRSIGVQPESMQPKPELTAVIQDYSSNGVPDSKNSLLSQSNDSERTEHEEAEAEEKDHKDGKRDDEDDGGGDDENEEDKDRVENLLPFGACKKTKPVSERRQKRISEFSNWFHKKTKELTTENAHLEKCEEEERMTIQNMVQSRNYIISEPREYQLELFEVAKSRNTIAVLDTGSGKTLIACLLIRHTLSEELEARLAGCHRRVSFFIVDNVTLVFQQAAVLSCNIDAKVGKYCGDMGLDLWKKPAWDKILDEEQVIVMTADVLYNCLVHSFIKMADINLICFDEAHHAKKRHAYARIVKDFYLDEPVGKRPKIFGMTASPVDAQVDVVQAAKELEQLLDSQIATTSDLSFFQTSANRPNEVIAPYKRLERPFETDLYRILHEKYGDVRNLSKVFKFAKQCTSELGSWCADQVWKFALSEDEALKIERKVERNMDKLDDPSEQTYQELEAKVAKEIEKIREARKLVMAYKFLDPVAKTDLSTKAFLLQRYINYVYRKETEDKCIIFVSRRYTARVLAVLLRKLGSPHLKLGVLIGNHTSGVGDENVSFRQQMITVSQFRRGKLNCLIATSVAEEGLDIPECSLIIRFDLYTTMIQYIQSRGRARHNVSKYLHMIEEDNSRHLEILSDVKKAEGVMRKFCQSLPADRLLDFQDHEALENEEHERYFVDPKSGAKLTFSAAIQVLSHFVGSLPFRPEDGGAEQAVYIVRKAGPKEYSSELVLPSSSPINSVDGPRMPSKSSAKRAVAFETCVQLRNKDHLDEHFLPKYRHKNRPRMANANLAVDTHRSRSYPTRAKPSFWDVKNNDVPAELWITIFKVENPLFMGQPLQPLCIATREKLPLVPSFLTYSDQGTKSYLTSIRLRKPLLVTNELIERLDNFTLRLFRDLFNKVFELDYGIIPYWLAPMKDGDYSEDSLAEDALDWEQMILIMSRSEIEWNENTPVETSKDRFFIDRRDKSRRFSAYDWDPSLTPQSRIPLDASQVPGIETIFEYSYNSSRKNSGKFKKFEQEFHKTQPVLVANRVLHRLNYLEPPNVKLKDGNITTKAYICPSAFLISMIPSRIMFMAIIFPAIITRIDGYLHSWDVCKMLNVGVSLDLALEALTKDSESNSDQTITEEGARHNYERLEFLGDCFLKLATTISLFAENHDNDEYELHVQRMVLVCNQYLFEKAIGMNIPEFIQSEGFSRRHWYPPMKLLSGKGAGKTSGPLTQKLGDKTIADVCEALIGAALLDGGFERATKMVSALLQTPNHDQKKWSDYYAKYNKPSYQTTLPSASQLKLADDIEKEVSYRFKSPRLLMSAFSHPSNPFSWEKVPSYQRLEFLGDALLDQACVKHIFDKYPTADPQWLTEHKMAMVSNKFLGAVCVTMGFHKKLRRVGQALDVAIRDYETEVMEAKETSNGNVGFWANITPPPKALPDILEAFIGALFVDSEFDYAVVQRFFDTYILPYFVDMSLYDTFAGQHPTTFLTNRMTDLGCTSWGYESEQFRDDDNHYILTAILVHNEVFAFGKGQSVKAGRLVASAAALEKLKDVKSFYKICNCSSTLQNRKAPSTLETRVE